MMRAVTGSWAAVPEIPWTATDGTTFGAMSAHAADILGRLEQVAGGLRNPVAVTELAVHVAELSLALRDMAGAELAADALVELGRTIERAHAAGHRRSLRRA
jgi:hypothetical protein